MTETPWPNWGEPATKGDVILATIYIRGCMVKLSQLALLAANSPNDKAALARALDDFTSAFDELRKTVDDIGGAPDA